MHITSTIQWKSINGTIFGLTTWVLFCLILFRYRNLFLYFFPVARTLTLWGAEMLNTFELNQQILQTFRSVPSALVPYARGYERTRIPLNKIKAIFKLPENCSILEILKTSLHSNPLRFVNVGFSWSQWRTLNTEILSTHFKYLCL